MNGPFHIPTFEDTVYGGQDPYSYSPPQSAYQPAPFPQQWQMPQPQAYSPAFSDRETKVSPMSMWGGILTDVGNFIASNGTRPMGSGLNHIMNLQQQADRRRTANQRGQQQNWQQNLQYGNYLQNVETNAFNREKYEEEVAYRKERDALADKAAAASSAFERQKWQHQAILAEREYIDKGWRKQELPDGRVFEINSRQLDEEGNPAIREIQPRTRMEQALTQQFEEGVVESSKPNPAAEKVTAEAQEIFDYITGGGRINTGSGAARSFQKLGQLFGGGEATDMTRRLLKLASEGTLQDAARVPGTLSDSDIALLNSMQVDGNSSEEEALRYLYNIMAGRERKKAIDDWARTAYQNGADPAAIQAGKADLYRSLLERDNKAFDKIVLERRAAAQERIEVVDQETLDNMAEMSNILYPQ